MSIAGGVGNAFLEGQKVDCEAIQIFTKSSRQWASKPLDKDEIAQFHANRKDTGIASVVAHDSYLLNLGSPDPALRKRSIGAFIDEMERCEVFGVSNLIAHPGAHVGAGEAEGIKTIAKSLDEVHKACPGIHGQSHPGNHRRPRLELGLPIRTDWRHDRRDQRKRPPSCLLRHRTRLCRRVRLRTKEGYERTFGEFDEAIGIKLLAAFHLNDSKKEFHSRVDRHEHIGQGFIGVEAFRLLMNDKRFWGLPMCLETPRTGSERRPRESDAARSLIKL